MRPDRLAAAEDGCDALLRPQGLVVAADELQAVGLGKLVGGPPAAVGDLVAGPVAEPDRDRAAGVDVGYVGVPGGGAMGVEQAVELDRGLASEPAAQLGVGADLLQPRRRSGLVAERARTDQGGPGERQRGRPGGLVERLGPAATQARTGAGGAECAEDEDVGLGVSLPLGTDQVAAVAGAEPAGEI